MPRQDVVAQDPVAQHRQEGVQQARALVWVVVVVGELTQVMPMGPLTAHRGHHPGLGVQDVLDVQYEAEDVEDEDEDRAEGVGVPGVEQPAPLLCRGRYAPLVVLRHRAQTLAGGASPGEQSSPLSIRASSSEPTPTTCVKMPWTTRERCLRVLATDRRDS